MLYVGVKTCKNHRLNVNLLPSNVIFHDFGALWWRLLGRKFYQLSTLVQYNCQKPYHMRRSCTCSIRAFAFTAMHNRLSVRRGSKSIIGYKPSAPFILRAVGYRTRDYSRKLIAFIADMSCERPFGVAGDAFYYLLRLILFTKPGKTKWLLCRKRQVVRLLWRDRPKSLLISLVLSILILDYNCWF